MGLLGQGFGIDPQTQAALQQILGQQGQQPTGVGMQGNPQSSLGQGQQPPSLGIGQYAAPAQGLAAAQPAAQAKPGFFHHGIGDILRNLAGGALDGVAMHFGGEPAFYNQQKQASEQAKQLQQLMLKTQLDAQGKVFDTDQQARLHQMNAKYDAENGKPSGAFAELADAAGYQPGTPEYIAAAKARLAAENDPTVTVTLPGNRVYSGPRSGLAAALGVAPNATTGGPGIPRITDPSMLKGKPKGFPFIAPDEMLHHYAGDGASNGTGGFRPGG